MKLHKNKRALLGVLVLLAFALMLIFVSCVAANDSCQDSEPSPTTLVGEDTLAPDNQTTVGVTSESGNQTTTGDTSEPEGQTTVEDTPGSEDQTTVDGETEGHPDESGIDSGTEESETGGDEETTAFENIERVIDKRYFIFKVWNFSERTQAEFEAIVDATVATGCNAIKIHVPWSVIEKERGVYQFERFDAMIDYVVNTKGLPVVLAIDISRYAGDTLLSVDDFMRSPDGFVSVGGGNNDWLQISFSSEAAMMAAVEYYENCIGHFHARYGDNVLFYQATFSQYAETEYWPANDLDYSLNAVKAFRVFLEEKYGTIENLNAALGTSYSSFKIVDPPTVDAVDSLAVLWYQFRHTQLKNAIDRLAGVQKAIAPESKIGVQFGSVFDQANDKRATAAFASLCENVDVVFVDDGPIYNHRWSMDYIRNMLPAHVEYGNDIDGPNQNHASVEAYKTQCMESYEHGATYITLSNWQVNDSYYEYEDAWKEVIAAWCNDDAPKTIEMKENVVIMEVSLYQMFCCKLYQCFQSYQHEYERLTADGNTTVLIHVVDDLTTRKLDTPHAVYSLQYDFYRTNSQSSPWSFYSYRRGEPIPMIFDEDRWRDESRTPFFSQNTINCGARDAGVKFTAPQSGKITYNAVIAKHDANGDGANIWLLRNGEEIYPTACLSSGSLHISLELTVEEGDEILLMFDKNNNTNADVFYYDIRVDSVE